MDRAMHRAIRLPGLDAGLTKTGLGGSQLVFRSLTVGKRACDADDNAQQQMLVPRKCAKVGEKMVLADITNRLPAAALVPPRPVSIKAGKSGSTSLVTLPEDMAATDVLLKKIEAGTSLRVYFGSATPDMPFQRDDKVLAKGGKELRMSSAHWSGHDVLFAEGEDTTGFTLRGFIEVNADKLKAHLDNPHDPLAAYDIVGAKGHYVKTAVVGEGDVSSMPLGAHMLRWVAVTIPDLGEVCVATIKAALVHGWFLAHPLVFGSKVLASSSGALATRYSMGLRVSVAIERRLTPQPYDHERQPFANHLRPALPLPGPPPPPPEQIEGGKSGSMSLVTLPEDLAATTALLNKIEAGKPLFVYFCRATPGSTLPPSADKALTKGDKTLRMSTVHRSGQFVFIAKGEDTTGFTRHGVIEVSVDKLKAHLASPHDPQAVYGIVKKTKVHLVSTAVVVDGDVTSMPLGAHMLRWVVVVIPGLEEVCVATIKAALVHGWFPVHPLVLGSEVLASSSGALATHSSAGFRACVANGRRLAAQLDMQPPATSSEEESMRWYATLFALHIGSLGGKAQYEAGELTCKGKVSSGTLAGKAEGGRKSIPTNTSTEYKFVKRHSDISFEIAFHIGQTDTQYSFGCWGPHKVYEYAQTCRVLLEMDPCPKYMLTTTKEALLDKAAGTFKEDMEKRARRDTMVAANINTYILPALKTLLLLRGPSAE